MNANPPTGLTGYRSPVMSADRWFKWWPRRQPSGIAHSAEQGDCQTCANPSAAFGPVLAHLAAGLQAHADRDGLTGVRRAVFIANGGHLHDSPCPNPPPPDPHAGHVAWCDWPDDDCVCGGWRHVG